VDVLTDAGRECPRCGGEVLAALRVPNGWQGGRGQQVRGTTEVLLCARCDQDDPITGPVVTFFAVHERATAETAGQLAVLLRRWAAGAVPPQVDEAALDAEAEAWYRGEL
jgi:Family of unknown function (DUF6300)